MSDAYLGIDIGSISTKGVVITEDGQIIARSYLWTEGNPTEASKRVVRELEQQLEDARSQDGADTHRGRRHHGKRPTSCRSHARSLGREE